MNRGHVTRVSESLIATVKEAPSDADAISHQLLVRGGFTRQLAAGLYTFLPSGWSVMQRAMGIIREEMRAIGGQEFLMPLINPRELWAQTGRDGADIMYKFRDRSDREMVLAFTHEEAMTWHASRELRSYRDLPQIWWHLQTKGRDEARARGGLLRTREFIMKDSYSFDRDEAGLDESYQRHAAAYNRIFERCGLDFYSVESDTGNMGGTMAHEYMAPCDAGENTVALCDACGYKANVEVATSTAVRAEAATDPGAPERIDTPDARTIDEVSAQLGVAPSALAKSLPYVGPNGLVLCLVRGDHELNEIKLGKLLGGDVRPAHADEITSDLGSVAGYIGPTGVNVPVFADETLVDTAFITGANEANAHLRGVMLGRDYEATVADLRNAANGDACSVCGATLRFEKVIEIGNIFKLGTRYSEPLNATYLDENGKEQFIVMGSYGIGPARILAASVEQTADEKGIAWPPAIAPHDVHVVALGDVGDAAERLSEELAESGLDVLFDDRGKQASAGVKFADAELIGVPVRVTIGARGVAAGTVDVQVRRTLQDETVQLASAVAAINDLLDDEDDVDGVTRHTRGKVAVASS